MKQAERILIAMIEIVMNAHYAMNRAIWGEQKEALGMAIKALEQTTWIPVSERLPDNRKEVLVYLSTGRMTIANYNEHKLPFSDKAIGWGYSPINGKIDFAKEDVIAWMPLPEPYREERTEE